MTKSRGICGYLSPEFLELRCFIFVPIAKTVAPVVIRIKPRFDWYMISIMIPANNKIIPKVWTT